ncbi:hypothetical protein TNIN_486161 [Trichonephila inaurata madagascariensis]|uniref:Uncharacterized protein n=1 Tax=Trichonephila inaurata madagascariensis TaxID=2747483 RepID=A0A8X6JME1_9ARAC|nr:hypothetical protein TNIN_486161 [Trichonephila inaurata madagascariensis]
MTNYTCDRFYQVRMPDEIIFFLQLLQLEEATSSPIEITTVGDLYAYLETEKLRYVIANFHNEHLNEKRMLYVLKEKPFHFEFR